MRFFSILVAAAAIVVVAACCTVQPILEVEKSPIVLTPGKNVNMSQVTTAIMRAGSRLGWQMQPEAPGRLSGRINVRTHSAVVDVQHDTKSYTIKYRESVGLNAKDGMIHRNYNSWIQNLDKNIRAELTLL
jgi:uncharacterized lipoprotein YajG